MKTCYTKCLPEFKSLPGERWRPVVGFTGYDVSNMGRVRSWRAAGRDPASRRVPLLRKPQYNAKTGGYMYVMLMVDSERKRLCQIHILVLEAFRGLRKVGQETRHLSNVTTDNRLSNLRWGTRPEQFADQVRAGTDTRGERNAQAKLTHAQAIEIRRRLAGGERGSDLAKEFGVGHPTITRIKKGIRYASAGT